MMSVKGEILATHTRELVHEFIMGVSGIAGLGEKSICREVFNTHWHIQYDPTKIMIDVSAVRWVLLVLVFWSFWASRLRGPGGHLLHPL